MTDMLFSARRAAGDDAWPLEELVRAQQLACEGKSLDEIAHALGRTSEDVRRRLQQEMPGASYITTTPFSEIIGSEKRSWSLGATMFLAFGLLALAVAAIGLYSVIAYNVAQRTHELGVRVALGAGAKDLLRLVLVDGRGAVRC